MLHSSSQVSKIDLNAPHVQAVVRLNEHEDKIPVHVQVPGGQKARVRMLRVCWTTTGCKHKVECFEFAGDVTCGFWSHLFLLQSSALECRGAARPGPKVRFLCLDAAGR